MKKDKLIKLIDWIIRLLGYTVVLILTALLFPKNIYIDSSYFYVWGLLAVFIIYILNRTVKPFIVWLTIPITGLTLGLFYPVINIIVLKITDLILYNHFQIRGVFSLFFICIFISVLNALMDTLLIKRLTRGTKK